MRISVHSFPLSLPLSHSLTHSLHLSLSLSLSLSVCRLKEKTVTLGLDASILKTSKHTHTHTLSLSLSHTVTHRLSSLSHMHAHTQSCSLSWLSQIGKTMRGREVSHLHLTWHPHWAKWYAIKRTLEGGHVKTPHRPCVFRLAALQDGRFCFCSGDVNALSGESPVNVTVECNTPCPNNTAGETCGGELHNEVFTTPDLVKGLELLPLSDSGSWNGRS